MDNNKLHFNIENVSDDECYDLTLLKEGDPVNFEQRVRICKDLTYYQHIINFFKNGFKIFKHPVVNQELYIQNNNRYINFNIVNEINLFKNVLFTDSNNMKYYDKNCTGIQFYNISSDNYRRNMYSMALIGQAINNIDKNIYDKYLNLSGKVKKVYPNDEDIITINQEYKNLSFFYFFI